MTPALPDSALNSRSTLSLTYAECRARFRSEVETAGLNWDAHYIAAEGRDGLRLSIDSAIIGNSAPERALLIMSGVHGVEAYIGSALQADLIACLAGAATLPPNMGILLIHSVNPWGMEWWRRQNESNVDLNRNWMRDEIDPPPNEGYDALHNDLCPPRGTSADLESMLEQMLRHANERGLEWVHDSITRGQYTHPDGMHFGGERCEESTRIVKSVASAFFRNAELALAVDIHTGHGDYGTYTLLSGKEIGSDQDIWLRSQFGDANVEATSGNPDAETGLKHGQIASGLARLVENGAYYSTLLEFGTVDAIELLSATYLEGWHARCGTRDLHEGIKAVWRYRTCFTPNDPEWVENAMQQGRTVLHNAVEAIAS